MTTNAEPPRVTIGKADLATMLGLSEKTVDRMRKRNEVPGVMRFGRSVRFSREVIEQWIKAKATGTPQAEG